MTFSTPLVSRLQHKINIVVKEESEDIENENWQHKLTTYAEIKSINDIHYSTIDRFSFGNLITQSYFIFRVRFVDDITTNMRIQFGKRVFEIKKVINYLEQNRILQIIALEIPNN